MPKKKKIYSDGVQIDNAHTSLADLGGLLKVTSVVPSFVKSDAEARDFLATKYQADADWLKVSKNIIDSKIPKKFNNRVRNFHHAIDKYSFPFDNPNEKGKQLFVLTAHFERVMLEYDSLADDFNQWVRDFAENFDQYVADAQQSLGGRFDIDLYPSVEDFADRPLTQEELDNSTAYFQNWKIFEGKDGKMWKQGLFHLRADWSQAPYIEEELDDSVFDERFRKDDHYSSWKKPSQSQLFAKISETQRRKESDFRQNIAKNSLDVLSSGLDAVINACINYNPKDKKSAPFRNTLLTNLSETVQVVEDRLESNLLGDSENLTKSIEKAKQVLNGVTVENLREDDSKRKEVADKLSDAKDEITDDEIANFQDLVG